MSIEEYSKARKAAMKQYRSATLAGTSPYPSVLDEILSYTETVGEQYLGTVEIPLELVVGTKTAGRKTAFTKDFLPLLNEKTEFASKWIRLYDSHMEEGIREPIKAYEFMNRFYVQEGNKRVSVLKYVDADSISASVTRIVPARTEEKENKVYYEFMAFYDLTGMNSIWFSEPGSYKKLLKLIGKSSKESWTSEEKSDLKSVYYYFSTLYEAISRNAPPIPTGDAFLIYLTIFDYKEAKDKSSYVLKQDLQKVWKEFVPASSNKSIEHLLDPQEVPTSFWNKLITPSPAKIKAAFIYDKPINDSSWLFSHELGRLHLMESYPKQVITTTYENVKPGEEADRVVADAIKQGNSIIFTTTPTFIQASLKAAVEHPEVKILNCSLNFAYRSIRTYYARIYEAKFLLGLVAGLLSKENEIAYVADYPIYGTMANINAFALGAQMMNPDIKIKLFWSCLKKELQNEDLDGISIVSARDMITPTGSDSRFGLYKNENGTITNLATTILNWGAFYDRIIRNVLDGTWKMELSREKKSLNYWWGISSKVIDVLCSSKLHPSTIKTVETFKNCICSGQFDPFGSILYDQNGQPHGQQDIPMSNEEIISMDWLYENIIGSIPEMEELEENALAVVRLQGIQEENI